MLLKHCYPYAGLYQCYLARPGPCLRFLNALEDLFSRPNLITVP